MRISTCCRAAAMVSAFAVLAACSALKGSITAVQPRLGAGGVVDTGALRFPRPDTGTVGVTTDPRSDVVRRVCRTSGWPRGWVATAYESGSGECPLRSGADSTALAAIIVRLDAHPVGAELDVCADQAVPKDWVLVNIEGAEPSARCPGAARNGASAIRRIRRVS
jgi:hypothetical protein